MIEEFDPLTDARWSKLTSRNPCVSVFHTPKWLQALQRTYEYTPVAITTSAPNSELENVILFCRVSTFPTGRRLVSLPFSDHCEPLAANAAEFPSLLSAVQQHAQTHGCKYLEMRPLSPASLAPSGLTESQTFCYHKLDLTPTAPELFHAFHKDCVQRKIHRAQREVLTHQEGRSPALLRQFFHLQMLTRRRHQLPPQPFAWFQNLATCMGDKLKIRVALKGSVPVAAILTLQHRQTLVYKYGASDKRYANLGGTPFLFWRAIQDAKAEGLTEFDLGRSDWENEGLIRFKDHLGAKRSTLTYWRYPASSVRSSQAGWKMAAARKIFSVLPTPILTAAGNLLYKHFA